MKSAEGPSSTGRRRVVTVLFSDLCASTSLAQAVDPEELAEIFRSVKAMAERIVRRHGGVANQFYGDGVLAAFGLAKPREDDARRAVEAALELHAAIAHLAFGDLMPQNFVARLHSGVHAGLVYLSQGDSVHGRYELVGDTVHVAARLCAAADRDQILVSERTVRAVRPFFETEDLGPVALKGLSEPFNVVRILGRSDISTRFEARVRYGLTPFVGRATELARLHEALNEAAAGHTQVVGIVGGAGMGKSRLLRQFIANLDDRPVQVFYGYCESYGTVAPLQPFRQLLRQVFELGHDLAGADASQATRDWIRARTPELTEDTSAFLRLLELPLEPQSEPANARELDAVGPVGRIFHALASKRPVVIVIDDWQWVDDASRRVLDALLQQVRALPVLVVTGSRGNDLNDPVMSGAPVFELSPFDREEATRIAHAVLATAPDDDTAEQILRRSGGNPLFVEELCHSLPEWHHEGASGTSDSEVPPSLHALIEARVERLPQTLTDLVETAAVIGTVVPDALLEAAGVEFEPEALEALARADLLYQGEASGQLRFKHGITRDVVYQGVGIRKRRRVHRAIAKAIEAQQAPGGTEPFEALAYHYGGAGDHEETARYAELAGDKALAVSSLYQAIHHYEVTMTALEKLGTTRPLQARWISVCLRWATACVYTPARQQLSVLRRTADYCQELGDQEALAHTYYALGYIHYALGDQDTAIRYFEQALEVARRLGQQLLTAQLELGLGVSYSAACEYDAALEYIDSGMRAKARILSGMARPPLSVSTAYTLGCKGNVFSDQGRFAEAHACFDEALDMARPSNHVVEGSILGLLLMALLRQGCWEESREAALRMRAVARRTNAPYVYAMSEIMGAYAEFQLNPAAETVERLQRNADWLEARDIRLFQSFNCYATLADARLSLGDRDRAREYATRALDRAKQRDRTGEAMAHRILARCAELDPATPAETARLLLDRALDAARARGARWDEATTRLAIAEHLTRRGRNDEASSWLEDARKAFDEMAMPWHLERAARLEHDRAKPWTTAAG